MYQYIFQLRQVCVVTTHMNLTIIMSTTIRTASTQHTNTNLQPCLSLSVFSYHVKYIFQSESALYICMNVKEPFAQNRYDI